MTAENATTPQKILIIEDNEALGDIIVRKLQDAGFETVLVDDGADGLRSMQEQAFDLVLLDMLLPTMSGYEILAAKQREPAIADVPVIIISNSGQRVEVERALSLGAEDYLVKADFTPEEVFSKVEELLGRKSLAKADTGTLGGKSLLLIEDEPFLRDLMEVKLKQYPFTLYEAETGEEALQKLTDQPVNLVVLDLILPNMSGFEVLKAIKENEDLQDIPVLILSNLSGDDDVRRCMELGAVDYLVKANNSITAIVERINELLTSGAKAA